MSRNVASPAASTSLYTSPLFNPVEDVGSAVPFSYLETINFVISFPLSSIYLTRSVGLI